ncbi:hypothetical protein C7T35_28935 [Variovorax sp. WS11]|uniref:hypothetical protein n=1 Tax=Variovorax sp. WS11 TaxID=1105204 RepID=UPI000D0D2785|nr:hypothetical protein [Variovorax sp. WS11]NDZ17248.1 hypothetical protein [Variovorax sp. WS11]PSL81078.1 hypothetical protein C7T35_28935 [Variovorax sp. WS11]
MQSFPPVDAVELKRLAARVKLNATEMVNIQGFGYLGQALSAGELIAALFGGGFVKAGHDRFVLSPGHYAVVVYAAACELGWIAREHMESYGLDGAVLEPGYVQQCLDTCARGNAWA